MTRPTTGSDGVARDPAADRRLADGFAQFHLSASSALRYWIDRALAAEQYVARNPVRCHDCGLPYGGPKWIEAVIPDHVWKEISPSGNEGGILCIACMAGRLRDRGFTEVPVWLVGMEPMRVPGQSKPEVR